jgi:hypothetical protein
LPRSLHLQALPATEFRVASSRVLRRFLRSKFRSPRSSSAGCASQCIPRVAPASASSGLAGDQSSSCLESLILQHLRRSSLELPPKLCPYGCACRCNPRVAPVPASSGCAGDGSSSHPESRPSVPLALLPRVAPRHRSPVAPLSEVTSRPALLTFRLCLGLESSSCPEFSSPSAPADGSPSCLGSRTFRLCRPCVSGLPRILHLRLG